MKTLNQIIKEATREINELPRRSKAFVDKHVVQKMDYPVDVEDQFTAKKLKKDKTKLASFHDGEDASVYEEVDLEEGVSNLSDARLKFHVLKDIPHGSYTKKEMAAEHLRRKKAGGPAYNAVKPSLNEESEAAYRKADRDEKRKAGAGEYYVTDHNNKRTHSEPFKTSDQAISHANKQEDKTGRIHTVHHIKNGKIQKQWQYSDSAGRFASYNDHAGQKTNIHEEVELGEAQVKKPTSYERAVALPDGEPDKSAKMGVNKAAYAAASAADAAKPKSQVSLKKAPWDMKKEEAELDEAKTDVYHKHMLKALGKSRLPKDHPYTSSIANNGDFVVRKGSEIAGRIPKGEHNLKEASMTPTDMKQREDIVKGMKKNTQDFKDRYGSKWKSVMYATATKAAMKEESEQIDESVSFKKTESGDHHIHYNGKPVGRITKTTSMGSSGYSVRFGGNTSKHEVSDESSLKAAKDSAKWHLTSSESPIKMKEESEQINEISRDLARRYIRRVADKNNTGQASPKEVMKRSPGVALAGKKAYGIGGKARVNATESVDLDEAFKAGAMKLNDGSSVTLTSESSNSLNNLFNQLSSPNKTKMEQRLMSGSKGFNEILAFAKEV